MNRTGVRTATALAGVAVCVVVAVFAPGPDRYVRSAMRFHDFLHVPGFVLVAALLLAGWRIAPCRPRRRSAHLALIFGLSVALGILVELLQVVAGGGGDPWDVARDAAGAASALLLASSFWSEVRRPARWALRLAALVVAAVFAVPTLGALLDESRARHQFPVLADFSRASEFDRFEWSGSAPASLVCTGGRGTRCVVQVSLLPGLYPGFALTYFPRDWRGFRHFVVSCANASDTPLALTIRIDDMRHNGRYTDRFNRTYVLAPGRNEVRVPLADVEAAPCGRRLDLGRVRDVVVFAYQLATPRRIVVHSLRLEH